MENANLIGKKDRNLIYVLAYILLAGQSFSVAMGQRAESPFLETEISKEETQAIEDFEKTKSEILQGRKFSNQSTATNAFLTLISAFHQQDQNTLGQVFPIIKHERFKRLASPEQSSKMLDIVSKSTICRIKVENKSPEERDLCAIYTSDSPDGEINQAWSFAYVEGAWRFVGSTSEVSNWIPQAEQVEAMTRNILQSEAEKAKESTTDTLQQDAGGQDDSEVVQGAPKPDKSTGNRVLSLDGEGGYVLIADSQSLHSFSDTITIEVWVKASSYAEYGDINSIIRKNIAGGAENFLLRFRNIDGNPWIQMSLSGIGILRAQHEFTVGKWYHLAGTYDGSAITVLVNGVTIESGKFSGPLYIDKSDLFIGKGDPEFSNGEYFHGELDELRIWNVARSQEEIRTEMNTPLTGKEEGLVVYLNFDNGTAKDLSGHGNDGLLDADAQIVESPFPISLAPGGEKPSKLIAWWKFENDANDSAGANHGTIHGNPTYADGKVGRAISLDGDDYVDCGNQDSLNFGTGDWTVSAWIKTTQSGTNQDDALMNRGTVFANGGDEVGGIRYALVVNEGKLGSITLTTDDDVQKAQAIGKTAVNDGTWHHIVGTRSEGQLRVYVDGVLDGGSYLPAGYDLSGTSQRNAYIGVITDIRDGSLYKYFVGLIDEVCIIRGAIDANGVRVLYSGDDPMTVAQTAIITRAAVAETQARPRPVTGAGSRGGIEGDWEIISDLVSSNALIEIRRGADGTLGAIIVAESPDETSPAIPLNNVTFENGKLRFEMLSDQGAFEGTMKEDGLTIEGQFQQQGQMMALVLKRVDAAPSEAAPASQEQLQDRTSGTSNIATALILVLALAGVVAGIVFFLVRSSIRR